MGDLQRYSVIRLSPFPNSLTPAASSTWPTQRFILKYDSRIQFQYDSRYAQEGQ